VTQAQIDEQSVGSETYGFDAIRGIQAGREFYVAMCPLKIIPKLFIFNDYDIPPELRAQRVLRDSRIPAIKDYILNNPDDYTFSSLTASVDGVMKTACDIHKDQVFEMGKRFEEIRELQEEIPLGTDDYFRLDQEFQVLTDEALEKRNWYIANCLE